jgi:hypothetical protein
VLENPVGIQEVGRFLDQTTETLAPWIPRRTAQATGLRVLEELVELLLELRVTPGDIFTAVTDSLANQANKLSATEGKTIFPSQIMPTLQAQPQHAINPNVIEEAADVTLTMRDLLYRLGIAEADLTAEERRKWDRFIAKQFAVSDKGCLYSRKPHMKY